jgi:protein O-GlcNAc transferase
MTKNYKLAKKHFEDGLLYLNQENFLAAEYQFLKSLEQLPDRISTLINLSAAQLKLNKFIESKKNIFKVIDLEHNNFEAYLNLGLIELTLKNFTEAIKYFDTSISFNKNYIEGWSNKGLALHALKLYGEAIICFDKSLANDLCNAEVWSNKGLSLHALNHHNDAMTCFDKSLDLNINYANAWLNKAELYRVLKKYEKALQCYKNALRLNPNIDWIYGNMLHTMLQISSWSEFDIYLELTITKLLNNEKASTPFPILGFSDDPFLQKKSSEIYINHNFPRNYSLGQIGNYTKKKKIRIGYFSSDIRDHPVAFLISGVFERHNKNNFDIYCFSLENSGLNSNIYNRIKNYSTQFIDVSSCSDIDIAKLARKLEIDIAVDLNGHTFNSRTAIFSYGAAPVQVNWLGYAGSLGADYFDYIVADKTVIPKSNLDFYVEKVIYFPNTFMVDDSKRCRLSKSFNRKDFNLPEKKIIFCCFNNAYKFNKSICKSWSSIMKRVNNSLLWISENNLLFKANIMNEFIQFGIDPSRIVFSDKLDSTSEHLSRLSLADIFLDTFPYGAHSTAIDSLKSGVPLITQIGRAFSSRVAASLLNAIEMPELVTYSREEYENLAVDLALNPNKLKALKQKLQDKICTAPLFDTQNYTKNLELAYQIVYQKYLDGESPDHIYL